MNSVLCIQCDETRGPYAFSAILFSHCQCVSLKSTIGSSLVQKRKQSDDLITNIQSIQRCSATCMEVLWHYDFLSIISDLIAVFFWGGGSHSDWLDQGIMCNILQDSKGDALHSFGKAVKWSVLLCMHTILTFQQYPKLGEEFSKALCTETIIGSILWICFETGNGEELQATLCTGR